MQLFPSLLFGVSASLDALLVGISYGIRKVHISLRQNLLISTITLLGTCLSVGLGHLLIPLLPVVISRYGGSLVLLLFGFWYIIRWIFSLLSPCREVTSTASKALADTLSLGETLGLGFGLSLNNMGIGFSASIAGLQLAPAAAATFLCSLVLLFFGNHLGKSRFLCFFRQAADPVSGLLLVLLALMQLFFSF